MALFKQNENRNKIRLGDHTGCVTLALGPNQIDWIDEGDFVTFLLF